MVVKLSYYRFPVHYGEQLVFKRKHLFSRLTSTQWLYLIALLLALSISYST